MSSQVLHSSRKLPNLAGQSMPMLNTLRVKMCFHPFKYLFLYFIQLTLATEKSPALFSILSLHQLFVHTDETPPEPSLLQADRSQLLQTSLIHHMLQTPHHLCGLSLDSCVWISCWRVQHPRQRPKCVSSVMSRAEVSPPLTCLAMLYFLYPRRLFAFFSLRTHC